jgi:GT2 family glycosyltransferase
VEARGGRPKMNSAGPRVTVIILNWNGKRHLEPCLASVLAQDPGERFDILLWDNASRDGSLDLVRARFPTVRTFQAKENLGFAKAMNRAVGMVQTEFIVFLNNDVRVERDWLRELLRTIGAADPHVAAVGSRLLLWRDGPQDGRINHAGGLLSPLGGGYDEGLGRSAQEFAGRPPVYETGIVSGGAALFRRQVFLDLGGFDEAFFLYFEDADLCYRALARGFLLLHASRSVVWHRLGATVGGYGVPGRLGLSQANRFRMLVKTAGPGLAWRLPAACGWALAGALWLVLHGQWRLAAAWLGGSWTGLVRPKGSWHARRVLRQGRTVTDKQLRARGQLLHLGAAVREARRLARWAGETE